MRTRWQDKMQTFHQTALDDTSPVSEVIRRFVADRSYGSSSEQVDLYKEVKTLAWDILLVAFVGLSRHGDKADRQSFEEMQGLHETLLRGQFSLLPLSVNAWVWQSPRSKGIRARKKLQELITQRIHNYQQGDTDSACLVASMKKESMTRPEEVRDHILMMTSSLAVKGLASFLTALLLNLFLFEVNSVKLIDRLRTMGGRDRDEIRKHLRSVCLETERLSPPIVGVMRRTTRDMVLEGGDGEPNTLLPRGWDVWLYFVGGGRDPAVFGETCMTFDPGRFLRDDIPEPFGFGVGSKSCLGKDFIRDIALVVAEHFLHTGISIEGNVSKPGLKGWLGWETATPEQWAADMKQLPTQHPAKPLMVHFAKH